MIIFVGRVNGFVGSFEEKGKNIDYTSLLPIKD